MQLLLRQAGAQRTFAVEAKPHDCFQSLFDRLSSSSTASSSGELVGGQCCLVEKRTRPIYRLGLVSLQTFESRGRSWPKDTTLATAGLLAGDFVTLYPRLRGGGGDGGSTGAESRSSFLEMYATKKAAKVSIDLSVFLSKHTHRSNCKCCATDSELLSELVLSQSCWSVDPRPPSSSCLSAICSLDKSEPL